MSQETLAKSTGCEVVDYLDVPCVSMAPIKFVSVAPWYTGSSQTQFYVPIQHFHLFNRHSSDVYEWLQNHLFRACCAHLYGSSNASQYLPKHFKTVILLAESVGHMGNLSSKLHKFAKEIYYYDSRCGLIFAPITTGDNNDLETLIIIADLNTFFPESE